MELLDLIFMMTWLEHIIIHIFRNILCYFMMMHIYMDAPMICIWVTWRLMVSLYEHLVHLMFEEIHPTLGWIDLWLENIFVSSHINCYIFMVLPFMDYGWDFFESFEVSNISGDSSFTSWMKEYMAEYFDAYHILLEQHYRTWDLHLCRWRRFDWSFEACMHLANGGILTWRYKHFHDFLMRHLLDVHFYYVVM